MLYLINIMSKTKSSPPKKVTKKVTTKKVTTKKVTKRATKTSKHSSGPKISTPKTPKGVSDAMYKFMSEEYCEFDAWNKCSSYAVVVAAVFWIELSFFSMYYYYDHFISPNVLLRVYLYPSSFHLKSFGYYRMDKSGAGQHRGIW